MRKDYPDNYLLIELHQMGSADRCHGVCGVIKPPRGANDDGV